MEILVDYNKFDSEPDSLPSLYEAIDDIVNDKYPFKAMIFKIGELDIIIYLCKSNAVIGAKKLVFHLADDAMCMMGNNIVMYFKDEVGKTVYDEINKRRQLIDQSIGEQKIFEANVDILCDVAMNIYVDTEGELIFIN